MDERTTKVQLAGDDDGIENAILSDVCDGLDFADGDREGSDSRSVWDDIESGIFGNVEDFGSFDLCGTEESGGRLPDVHSSSDNTSQRHLSISRRGRKGVESGFADEYTGIEREAWDMLFERVRNAFITAAPKKKREEALRWCMTYTDSPSEGTMEECCQALGVRLHVLLLRLHYEWWLKGMSFEEGFGFYCKQIPDSIATEIKYYGSEEMYQVSARIWEKPGMPISEAVLGNMNLVSEVENMVRMGYFGEKEARLYLIGRNPLLRDTPTPWHRLF